MGARVAVRVVFYFAGLACIIFPLAILAFLGFGSLWLGLRGDDEDVLR